MRAWSVPCVVVVAAACALTDCGGRTVRYDAASHLDAGSGAADAAVPPPDASPPPPDCCASDSDCAAGSGQLVCVGAPVGVCVPQPDPGRCWVDSDCDEGQSCVGARWCDCETECYRPFQQGVCASGDLAQCVERFSDCGCDPSPDCQGVDGFTIIVFYPEDEGPFPSDIFPPDELLDVAVAQYECAICECDSYSIKQNGQWATVDVVEFCTHILEYDDACGGCLTEWMGGCC